MPHSHSNTELYARKIEDQIERLLRRGNEISNVLNKEMKQAKHRQQQSRSRSNSKSPSTTRAPAQLITPASICHESVSPPLNSPLQAKSNSKEVKISNHRCVQLSASKVIDLETNVELRSFPVENLTSVKTVSSVISEENSQISRFFKDQSYAKLYTNKQIVMSQSRQYLVITTIFGAGDPKSKWVRVNEEWYTDDGRQIVNLWTDLLGEETRTVWANGKLIKD